MNKQAVQNLYNNLKARANGFDVEYADFEKQIQDEQKRKNLHKNLTERVDGFDVDYPTFTQKLGLNEQQATTIGDDSRSAAFGGMADPIYSGMYNYHQAVKDKEDALQREEAATLPISHADKERDAEIRRLTAEGAFTGEPNGTTLSIDPNTGSPVMNIVKGQGLQYHPEYNLNQAEIDRLKAEQPSYMTREVKTPQDLLAKTAEAWSANTPEGQNAKEMLELGLIDKEEYTQMMVKANEDYINQQNRILGQKATNATIADISRTINPIIEQLQAERREAMQRAAGQGQMRGGAYGAIGAQMSANMAYDSKKDAVLSEYLQAQQYLVDAVKISQAAQKGQGFWKGLGNSLGDVDTWDMGISQLVRSANLKKIVEKYEKQPDSLTDSERALMDAAVAYMSACAYNSDKLSRLYKAGQTTGESLPFMLQFAVMPIGAIKDKVAKGVLGYGIEQFGGKALQSAGKYTFGRAAAETGTALLGNIAAAGVQTAAFGVPKITEGTISRMTGDIKPEFDENGRIVYGGRENQQGLGEALWNAGVDTYVENLSEMILTSGDPIKAFVRGTDLFKNLTKNEAIQVLTKMSEKWGESTLGKMASRMQFRNYPEEVAEEYVGNLLRWGASTDVNSAAEAGLDADSQIDLWMGLAPTSIAFAGLGLGEYSVRGGIDRFQSSQAARKLRKIMLEGEERKYLDNLLKSRDSDEFKFAAHDVVKSILRNDKLSDQEKRAYLDNLYVTYQSQLALEAEDAKIADELKTEVQGITNKNNGYVYPVSLAGDPNTQGHIVAGYVEVDVTDPSKPRIGNDEIVTVKLNDGRVVQLSTKELDLTGTPQMAQEVFNTRADERINAQRLIDKSKSAFHEGEEGTIQVPNPQTGELDELPSKILSVTDEGVQVEITDFAGQSTTALIPHDEALRSLRVVKPQEVQQEQPQAQETPAEQTVVQQPQAAVEPTADNIVIFSNGTEEKQAIDNGDGTYTIMEKGENNEDIPFKQTEEWLNDRGYARVEQEQPADTQEPQLPTEPAASTPVVPNIDTMSAEELGGATVEYMGDKASATAYLEAERDKADAEVKRTSKLKVSRFDGIEDFKRQNDQIQAAKRAAIDRYNKIQSAITAVNAYKTQAELQEEAERKAREAAMREQRRQLAEAEAAGDIEAKWQNTKKTVGFAATKTLPNGQKVNGHYILTEAGDVIPSHDPRQNYADSEGYVMENGQNVNDNNYKDPEVQKIANDIAQNYGGQAVEQMPFLENKAGRVLSGNNRTISGIIAAENNTDQAYLAALAENAQQFGFTPEQLAEYQHPRLQFVVEDELPFTTGTFAMFNQQEKKTKSSVNRAIANSKMVTEAVRDKMLEVMDQYDSLDSFFGSENAAADIVQSLISEGLMTQQEVAGLTENTGTGFKFSQSGREYVTDMLLGTLFDEQTIRMLAGEKTLKQAILRALPSIVENRRLKGYELTESINKAVQILYEARKANEGKSTADAFQLFLRQVDAFQGKVTDRFDGFDIILANRMSAGVEQLREILGLYNNSAMNEANGQMGFFEPRTIDDIKQDVYEYYTNQQPELAAALNGAAATGAQPQSAVPSGAANEGETRQEGIDPEQLSELRKQAQEFSDKLGVPIVVFDSIDEVPDSESVAKELYKKEGNNVDAWMSADGKTIYVNANSPEIQSEGGLRRKVFHEIVAHKGLRQLMGNQVFEQLCAYVWEAMPVDQRVKYYDYAQQNYPGRSENELRLIAADEYMAFNAEQFTSLDTNDQSEAANKVRTIWQKIADKLRELLDKILGDSYMTDDFLAELYKISYNNLRQQAQTTGEEQPLSPVENAANDQSSASTTIGGSEKATEIEKVIADFKKQYPDPNVAIFFRNGKTYDIYGEDAVKAAEILGVEPTEKDGMPFVSFPTEDVGTNLRKFITNGVKVGIASHPAHKPSKGDYQQGDKFMWEGKEAIIKGFTHFGTAIVEVDGSRRELSREQLDDILDYGDYMYHVGDVVTYNGKRAQIVEFASGEPVIEVEGESERRYVSFSDIERVKKETPTEDNAHLSDNKSAFVAPQMPIDTQTNAQKQSKAPSEDEQQQAAQYLNEALQEVISKSGDKLPQNITIDENTIEDNPDSVEMTARLLIDGKPSDFSVTIFDQSLGARGGFDPVNMVKFYPREELDKWDWDLADRLAEEFNKTRTQESGLATVMDESDAVYFFNMQAALDFAEKARQEIAPTEDPRFSVSGTQVIPVGEKTLVGLHNISAEKLRKVMKAGGLANPSAAVIDIAKQDHHDYGEVSLVLPSSLVERADGTYPGDAWTPMYPPVEYRASKDTEKRIKALTKGMPDNLASAIALRIRDYMDGNSRNSGMEYLYLKEQGRELPIEHTPRRYPYISIKQIADRLGIAEPEYWSSDVYQAYEQLPEDQLFDFNLWLEQNGNQEEIDKRKAMVERWRSEGKDAFANTWVGRQSERMSFAAFDSAGYRILRDERDAGEENTGMTLDKASYIVDTEGLRPEFETWLQQKIDGLGYEEVLFGGYTQSGNRRWLPNTVENASKLMNQKSETNYLDRQSVNETKAMLMDKLRTLSDIRKHKGQLEPDDEKIREAYEQASQDWGQLGIDFRDYTTNEDKTAYGLDDNPFTAIDTALARLQEAMFKRDPIAFLNREYRYSLPADSEFGTRLKEMMKRIKNLPSRYFETKFRRPVYLNEFANAVVPNDLPQDLRAGLEGAGLRLFDYDPNAQGSRRDATLEATAGEGIRFSVSGNGYNRYADEMESIKNNALNDGTFMKAPNGKPTNLDERQWLQVRTRAFKRWFGDWENDPQNASKVLDENGEPMVMYHGTHKDFTTFDKRKIFATNFGKGFYFISDMNKALAYGHYLMPVFLNVRNPLDLTTGENDAEYNKWYGKKRNPYDGYTFIPTIPGVNYTMVVAPEPNQIKSAINNNGDFSEENDDIRFSISNQNNDIFYSNAERAVESIKQEKATPEQWRAMIEKAGGLKAGEDKWIGLSDWLAQQRPTVTPQEGETRSQFVERAAAENKRFTLSKQDLLDYIREHKIQIEEVEYGDVTDSGEFKRLEDEFSELCWNIDEVYTQRWVEANNEVEKFYDEMRNKYGDEYLDALSPEEQRLENYLLDAREVYNKENPNEDDAFQEMVRRYGDDFEMAFWHDGARLFSNDNSAAAYFADEANAINDTRLKYTTEGLENKREIALTVPTIESWNENDEIHFGDAGEGRAVAWVRFGDTDRTLVDGRDTYANVLVIDEIQSKRHQEGREKGYYDGASSKELMRQMDSAEKAYTDYLEGLREKYGVDRKPELFGKLNEEEVAEAYRLNEAANNARRAWFASSKDAVPAAPFEKNWHELAMKRILRFAAENGYDKVAWTTGEQQAERYNIGHHVDGIDAIPFKAGVEPHIDYDGTQVLIYTQGDTLDLNVNGDGVIVEGNGYSSSEYEGKQLADVVGKEIAKKLLTGEEVKLRGEDFRIGGEGMRGFYDDILPRFMQKYGKKWGVQVGEVTMPDLEEGYQTMHAIDINDAMRESVMEGQPMFSISGRGVSGTMKPQEGETRSQYIARVAETVKNMTPRNTTIDDAIRFSITVNHNSPYLLKRADGAFVDPETGERLGFDMRFMGRGEGAQAHGYGSYFSVYDLRHYANQSLMNGGIGQYFDTEKIDAIDPHGRSRAVEAIENYRRTGIPIDQHLEYQIADYQKAVDKHRAEGRNEVADTVAAYIKEFEAALAGYKGAVRHHYTVDIPDNDGTNYIDEDKPMDDVQMAILRNEIEKEILRLDKEQYIRERDYFGNIGAKAEWAGHENDIVDYLLKQFPNGMKGRDLYYNVKAILHKYHPYDEDKEASEFLNRIGFVGIHYDGHRDGECYVIFNPDDAVITDHIRFSVTSGKSVLPKTTDASQVEHPMRSTYNTNGDIVGDDQIRFSVVTSRKKIAELEAGEKIKVYRAAQVIDGKLYPPMAAKQQGQLVKPIELGRWEQAEEHPELAKDGKFKLDKANGSSVVPAAYNPYFHTSRSPLNDQFSSAYDRPNLVTLEVEVPASELTSGYKAEGAKDAVGETNWHSGAVSGKLAKVGEPRKVILSRWDKPLRIVPDAEVAEKIAGMLAGKDIAIPYNVVTPSLRAELEKQGVIISEQASGTVKKPKEEIRFSVNNPSTLSRSETVTKALVQQANNNYNIMQSALKKVTADLKGIRAAMRMQSDYDRKVVDALLNLYNTLLQENGVWAQYMPDTTRRIATQIVHAIGKQNITEEVNTIMDHMVHAQAKAAQRQWDKLRQTPIDKINISGVVMQGKVALEGQHALKAMNDALQANMTIEQIEEQINQLMDMEDNATDESLKTQYKGQWIGLTIAAQHLERLQHLQVERQQLDLELQSARSNKALKPAARQQLVENIKQAMRDNYIEQAEAYTRSTQDLSEYVNTQEGRAKDFIRRQDANRDKIRSYAQRDLEGLATNPNRNRTRGNVARSIWDAFASPIRDLQSLLRLTGLHAPDGEGYLYNHFMRNWMDGADMERTGIVAASKTLDEKIAELTHGKYKTWEEAARKINDASHNMFTITMLNGVDGKDMPVEEEIPLNAGNALYIYAVNKMNDGRMKLNGMNITEEDVKALADKVREQFGQEILDVVDWVQSEFFSQLRNRYNPTHEALFGAPMDAIENYFPLRINANARQQNEDLSEPDTDAARLLAGTSTGAIKRRTRNSLPLDVRNADFFQEVIRHISQMERWNAFAQWNRDANILFSDINFRNRIKGMKGTIYGEGDKLYNYMKDAFRVAIGTYKPNADGFSKEILNAAKGVTSAKINFRVFTALKQIASFPAFFTYMQDGTFVTSYLRNWLTPHNTMKWAKENLPNFEKRVSKRDMGDMRLMQRSTDWQWNKRILEWSSKYGMFFNVFFDTLTCATGARAVYDSHLADYMKKGYSEEDARNRARQDAEQAFNTSQQSSEGAFMSAVQQDRNLVTAALTVFRTSPIQYTRNFFYHTRNLLRKFGEGKRDEQIAFRMGQYKNDGLNDEQARKAAEKDYNKSLRQDIVGFVVYGALLNILWRLAGQIPYLLLGDDDDKKNQILDDATSGGAWFSPFTGLLGGGIVESALDGNGSVADMFAPEMPFTQDIKRAGQYLSNDKYAEFASQALSVLMQSGTGFDPLTASDMVSRIVTTLDSEEELDAATQALRVSQALLSIPQSQYEQMLIDKVVSGETDEDAALEDYIRYYKVHTAPLTWWLRNEENDIEAEENAATRFNMILTERDKIKNPEDYEE